MQCWWPFLAHSLSLLISGACEARWGLLSALAWAEAKTALVSLGWWVGELGNSGFAQTGAFLKAQAEEGLSLVLPVPWKAPEQEGISWLPGSHLHSLALQVSEIHMDILAHSSTDFHSKLSHFLHGEWWFFLLLGRVWILSVDVLGRKVLLKWKAFLAAWKFWPVRTHFFPLAFDHGNHSVKAAPFSPLGGAGFTAQPSAPDRCRWSLKGGCS